MSEAITDEGATQQDGATSHTARIFRNSERTISRHLSKGTMAPYSPDLYTGELSDVVYLEGLHGSKCAKSDQMLKK